MYTQENYVNRLVFKSLLVQVELVAICPLCLTVSRFECYLDPRVRDAIFLSSDRNTWLTIIKPSADGACGNSTVRTSVTFGVDMRTGCTIR